MTDDLFLKKKKKKKKKSDFFEGEGVDHPVHEEYAEQKPVKNS
jgi:hypothetical protein